MALTSALMARAASGGQFIVQKEQIFEQLSAGAPTPTVLPSPYQFGAQAPLAATITPPGLPAMTLPFNSDNTDYELNQFFTTKAAMDAAFPNGTYTLSGSGFSTVSVDLTNDIYPSQPPQVTGGTWQNGVLIVDSAQTVTLNFNTFSTYGTVGAGSYENFKLQSETPNDNVNLHQQYGSAAISGLTQSSTPFTSYTIPGGTLQPGSVYQALLTYGNLVTLNTTQISGSLIASLYSMPTVFYVGTKSASAVTPPTIVSQPSNQTALSGSNATFTFGVSNQTPSNTSYIWFFNGNTINIDGIHYVYNGRSLTINNVSALDAGVYGVIAVNSAGRANSQTATLTVTTPTTAPVFTLQPTPATINGSFSGTTVVFKATAVNAASYRWKLNGQNITQSGVSGVNSATLLISHASNINAGTYTCVATNSIGSTTSDGATLTVINTSNPGRLINLSVLSNVQGTLTAGFVIGGVGTSGSENLLIRATGPALAPAPFNVPNVLSDPTLSVNQQSSSTIVASNSGWGTPSSNVAIINAADSAVGAFALTDSSSKDSALVTSLAPSVGGYTVQVKGASGDSGNALTEVYDATASYTVSTPRLVNLSCLTQVNAGGTLTAGFVIGGSTARTVLVRATGPALAVAPFNVGGTMPDPQIKVQALGGSSVLASNAGWGGDLQITATDSAVGAFALTDIASKDSVVLLTLAPGPYTAQVTSVSGAGGFALVEVYEVP